MVPTGNTSLNVLWAEHDLAETKHFTSSLLVYGFTALFALTALANLATFVWVGQHRLLADRGNTFVRLGGVVPLDYWHTSCRRPRAQRRTVPAPNR